MSIALLLKTSPQRILTGPWLLLDNDGSFNRFFDWVPRYLRVGPWKPWAGLFLSGLVFSLAYFVPNLHFPFSPSQPFSRWWWLHTACAAWTGFIAFRGLRQNPAPYLVSYTGVSWLLLTTRTACAVLAASLGDTLVVGTSAALVAECLRFPAAVGATVTFVVWNLVLAPIIYVMFTKSPKRQRAFVNFNFSFQLVNLHLCNLPLAYLSLAAGGKASGARGFTHADLWCGFLVATVYSAFYILVLDRVGVHLYPIFSPRAHFSLLGYMSLIGVYFGAFHLWNMFLPIAE